MKLDELFPSRFVSAVDIPPDKEVKAIIAAVELATLGDDAGVTKPAISFEGAQKRLLLNRENASRIARMYGSETDDWIGRELVLYRDQVLFHGRTVDGVRVKVDPSKVPGRAVPSDAPSGDDCPF